MNPPPAFAERVPLAPYCTMGVGGAARLFVEAASEAVVSDALAAATARGVRWLVLGGGSNLVVGDDGVDALVVKIGVRGISVSRTGTTVDVTAAAGEPWDELVRHAVEQGWAGMECLSGIPGLVGATPIQNVGAYGQDVSESIVTVRALDTRTARVSEMSSRECDFSYRDSVFKSGEPGRYIVLGVTYRLHAGGPPALRYAEVERHLESRGVTRPDLGAVRETVLAIRRSKSMVIEPGDPNRRSCGSFFTNPIVTSEDVARIATILAGETMPRWPQPDGRVKLSAAWLIERAGFARGTRDGAVGLSSRHALAIVAHDGACAADVLRLAARVAATVTSRFGVMLVPEPVFWGFGDHALRPSAENRGALA